MSLNKDQKKPTPNKSKPIWELVIADMKERNEVGTARYGTPLQAFNGRDALMDVYQELLDAAVYIRQQIEETKQKCDYCKGHCCGGRKDD